MNPAHQQVTVNGRPCELDGITAHTTALAWLRDLGLTGAKEGCAEGECGACSVLVARPDGEDRTQWTAINACLVPAAALEGQEVITSEGLGSPRALHPVQQEMVVRGGSQCGYCTPGFVCSMAAEFYRSDRTPSATPASAEDGHWPAPERGDSAGRPPGQRGIPGRDARDVTAQAPGAASWATKAAEARGGRGMSALAERPASGVVGEAIPHESATLHVTGAALYTDDLVLRTGGVLHAYPVQALHARARVTRLDPAPALAVPAWCGCSPRSTCRASTTRASSTTSRSSPTR